MAGLVDGVVVVGGIAKGRGMKMLEIVFCYGVRYQDQSMAFWFSYLDCLSRTRGYSSISSYFQSKSTEDTLRRLASLLDNTVHARRRPGRPRGDLYTAYVWRVCGRIDEMRRKGGPVERGGVADLVNKIASGDSVGARVR